MTKEQPKHQLNVLHTDDTSLFEIIESIWKEKILIIAITVIITSIAVIYTFTAQPAYQATTVFYQPSASSIQSYNIGRKEAELPEYTIANVYDIFLTNLNSHQLRKTFFEEVYLPSLNPAQQQAPLSTLISNLNDAILVKQLSSNTSNEHQITAISQNAEEAAEWANLFLQKAIELSKKEIETDIFSELSIRKKSINLRIDNLITKAWAERQDEIIRLKEALIIAKAIGLENPTLPDGKNTTEGANYVDRNLSYMRGSKALESQIKALEARKDDFAFVPEIRDLTSQLDFLNSLEQNFDKADVIQLDRKALAADAPFKPNKRLIIIVSSILSGVLGVFIALIRTAVRNRKPHQL